MQPRQFLQQAIKTISRCLLVIPLLVGVKCWASQETKFERSVTQLVTSIGYSDRVATSMISVLSQWKMPDGTSTIAGWEAKFSASAQDKAKVAANRLDVCASVAKMISQTFRPGEPYDLVDVLDSKQAQCVGYSQLFWVIANALGIQTAILTVERYSDLERVPKVGHVEKNKRGRWFKYNLTLKERGSRIGAYAETSET